MLFRLAWRESGTYGTNDQDTHGFRLEELDSAYMVTIYHTIGGRRDHGN